MSRLAALLIVLAVATNPAVALNCNGWCSQHAASGAAGPGCQHDSSQEPTRVGRAACDSDAADAVFIPEAARRAASIHRQDSVRPAVRFDVQATVIARLAGSPASSPVTSPPRSAALRV